MPTASTPYLWFSPRERQVLLGICRQQSNKEIAAALDLTVGTVKNIISSLISKMNRGRRSRPIQDRADLLVWAMQHPDDARRGVTHDPTVHQPGCRCGSPGCAVILQLAA